jgi:hypothetical protein
VTAWRAGFLERLMAAPAPDEVLREMLAHRALFERLLQSATSRRIWVNFCAQLTTIEAGLAGFFSSENGVPSIDLFRAEGAGVADDPLVELVTLAHELGHAQSWLEGHHTASYLAISTDVLEGRGPFTDEQVALVLDEESRAWNRGQRTLAEMGAGSAVTASLQVNREASLREYCRRLGAAEARWSERLQECENAPRGEQPRYHCPTCLGEGVALAEVDDA